MKRVPEETYLNIAEQMEVRCTAEGEDYKDLYNHRLNFLDGKTIKRWARVKENYNRRAAPVFG